MRPFLLAGLLLVTTWVAKAGDTFSLVVSERNTLVVFGPHGEKVSELAFPTIARPTDAGNESFVLSFGHDLNGYTQAIVEPSANHPTSLHFCVLGRHIYAAPSAVITLTFSENIDRVTVDPGVDGTVQVDGRSIRTSHSFAENWRAPATVSKPEITSTPSHAPEPVRPKSAPTVASSTPPPKKKKAREAASSPAVATGESRGATTEPAQPPSAQKVAPVEKSEAATPVPAQPVAYAPTPATSSVPPDVTAPIPANGGTPQSTSAGANANAAANATAGLPDVSATLALPGQKAAPGQPGEEELPGPGAIAAPGQAVTDNGDINFTPVPPAQGNALPPLPRLELNTSKQYHSVLPELSADEKNPLYQPTLFVKRFEFTGNTVYSSSTLAGLVTKYAGRVITTAELSAAAQVITLYYVDHGYINSGALLPDQLPKDGVIKLQIVEGKLTKVVVKGNFWFQTWWLRNQIRLAAGTPLNFNDLKLGIQNLREVPTLEQVNAELQPGGEPGESTLDMTVKDSQPFRASIEINNYRPPSVGSTIIEAHATDLNLTGNNDPLVLSYGIATLDQNTFYLDNLENWSADYTFPVSPWDTTMEVGADRNNTGIQEAPFNQLTINSRLEEYHVAFHQALISTPTQSLVLSLQADERRNVSSLFGVPFSLTPGAVNGVEQVFVPRFIQEYVQRTQQIVFSARSQFSLGLDTFNSTVNPVPPDGKFFDWLGQAQYIQRLGQSDNTLIAKMSGQIADRPLLSLEQSQLGGINSIRGYLENQALRDDSYLASVEFHLPLVVDDEHNSLIALAPFTDFGVGWNNINEAGPDPNKTRELGRQTVAMPSVGTGLLVTPTKYVSGQIYWGYALNQRQAPDGPSLQNQGVEFSLMLNAF